MFEVICTGKNECYGKKGEVRNLCDNHVLDALKEGWITPRIKHLGSASKWTKQNIPVKRELIPIKKIDALNILTVQQNALKQIKDKLDWIDKKNKELTKLIHSKKY